MALDIPLLLAPLLGTVHCLVGHVEEESRQINRFTAPDFTPFHFIPQGEVPTTQLLAFLLKASQTHGQGSLFQDLFIAQLRALPQIKQRLPQATIWRVDAEKSFSDVGRLDLLLTAPGYPGFGICIENKPRDQTGDQPKQLTRYRDYLGAHHQEQYLLLYLSRTARLPSEDSITTELRNELEASGHYANITYQHFLLPLVENWQRAAKPKHLRRFIQQFRYHLEQYLNLPATKPASLMKDTAIATELQATPASVGAAFDIAAALPTLRRNLIAQLMQVLAAPAPGLVGSLHWSWDEFKNSIDGQPFIIRRINDSLGTQPANWPWGRYAIAIEFDNGRLYYGIRYDTTAWHSTDTGEHHYTYNEVLPLAALLGVALDKDDWWLWWAYAMPEAAYGTRDENMRATCVAIADSSSQLLPTLLGEIQRLTQALDTFHGALAQ
jgi:hypothetical protein